MPRTPAARPTLPPDRPPLGPVEVLSFLIGLLSGVAQLAGPFFGQPTTGVFVAVAAVWFGCAGVLVRAVRREVRSRPRTGRRPWLPIAVVDFTVLAGGVAVVVLLFSVDLRGPAAVARTPATTTSTTTAVTATTAVTTTTTTDASAAKPDRCAHADEVEVRAEVVVPATAGLDLDCGVTLDPVGDAAGYEISGRRGGREVDSLGGRLALAELDDLPLTDFGRCEGVPSTEYTKTVHRVDEPPSGRGICVRTTGGGLAIVKLLSAHLPGTDLHVEYAIRRGKR